MDVNLGCGLDPWGYGIDKDPNTAPDLVADIHDLPLEDESVRRVRCYEVLEHVDSPLLVFQEIARILEPGGTLSVTVPNVHHIFGLLRFIKSGRLTVAQEHIQAFRHSELEHMGQKVGLNVAYVDYVTWPQYHKKRWFLGWLPKRLKHHSLKVVFHKPLIPSCPGSLYKAT